MFGYQEDNEPRPTIDWKPRKGLEEVNLVAYILARGIGEREENLTHPARTPPPYSPGVRMPVHFPRPTPPMPSLVGQTLQRIRSRYAEQGDMIGRHDSMSRDAQDLQGRIIMDFLASRRRAHAIGKQWTSRICL